MRLLVLEFEKLDLWNGEVSEFKTEVWNGKENWKDKFSDCEGLGKRRS
jgi:hypothetical protein